MDLGQQMIERGSWPMTALSLILDQMLPGDADRNLPSFDMLEIDLGAAFYEGRIQSCRKDGGARQRGYRHQCVS